MIFHTGMNDLAESQPDDIIRDLTDIAEQAINVRHSIEISLSGFDQQEGYECK